MGGSISVESVPGVGSEFRFFVTVRKVTGENADRPPRDGRC